MQPKPLSLRSADEELMQLELTVARRADELARVTPSGGSAHRDRETWLRAERELLPDLSGDRAVDHTARRLR